VKRLFNAGTHLEIDVQMIKSVADDPVRLRIMAE